MHEEPRARRKLGIQETVRGEAGRKAGNERRCKSGLIIEKSSRAQLCESGKY